MASAPTAIHASAGLHHHPVFAHLAILVTSSCAHCRVTLPKAIASVSLGQLPLFVGLKGEFLMQLISCRWLVGLTLLAPAVVGCAEMRGRYRHPEETRTMGVDATRYPQLGHPNPNPGVVQASAASAEPGDLVGPNATTGPVEVDELVKFAVARNPRLGKATFAIEAAQGRFVQAGLYPNPELGINWDEIGDRTGPGGILTVPKLSQQIVTGRKLSLSQAVSANEVNQSTLDLLGERYAVVGSVRAAFYDLYSLERRVAILDEIVKLAADAVSNGNKLLEGKQIAKLDLLQLEVELERFRAKAEASRREVPGARKRLAAAIGDPRMAIASVAGPFEEVPKYDAERTLETVLATHPEVRRARVGVERAQAAIRRAEVEVIPNLTFTTGYIRQYENQSRDFALGLSAPIPVWNRNQGNIRTAKAELGMAVQDVGRMENDLAERVATALRSYASALKEADQYKNEIIPRAEETYKLSVEAFKGGQFEYLRVIQSQRTVAEARLEYNRALGDAWKASAELSALLLEEWWPGVPPQKIPKIGPVVPPPKP
jgi:cobalt-zinc-cadmium efflux system outer membrane protein